MLVFLYSATMFDLLYWSVRVALVAMWVVVALQAWRRWCSVRSVWLGFSVLALVFASMRSYRWNYALLEGARGMLRDAGVYSDRTWIKVALAVALIAFICMAVSKMRRVVRDPAALLCGAGLGLQAVLLLVETMSLDDYVPQFCLQQPLRYLAEACFGAVALAALRWRSDSAEL